MGSHRLCFFGRVQVNREKSYLRVAGKSFLTCKLCDWIWPQLNRIFASCPLPWFFNITVNPGSACAAFSRLTGRGVSVVLSRFDDMLLIHWFRSDHSNCWFDFIFSYSLSGFFWQSVVSSYKCFYCCCFCKRSQFGHSFNLFLKKCNHLWFHFYRECTYWLLLWTHGGFFSKSPSAVCSGGLCDLLQRLIGHCRRSCAIILNLRGFTWQCNTFFHKMVINDSWNLEMVRTLLSCELELVFLDCLLTNSKHTYVNFKFACIGHQLCWFSLRFLHVFLGIPLIQRHECHVWN